MGLSPAYAPVEQHPLAPGHTDQRSDIYSLGATLYQLLTGTVPEPSFERIKTPAADPLLPPRHLNPRLSPHVATAISKAMSLKPDDRNPTIAAFQQALFGQPAAPVAATPLAAPLPPTIPVVPPAPLVVAAKRPATLMRFVGAGLGLVALLAVISVFRWGALRISSVPNTPVPVTIAAWKDELARRNETFGQCEGYWCYVRPGTYRIGGWDKDQASADLQLGGFWIGKYEVTVQQYREFMQAGGYTTEKWWTPEG